MNEVEFDRFADEYRATHAQNIRASGEGPEYFAAYKIADVARVWEQLFPEITAPAILDFGGGTGNSVPFFRRHFPQPDGSFQVEFKIYPHYIQMDPGSRLNVYGIHLVLQEWGANEGINEPTHGIQAAHVLEALMHE